MLKLRIRCTVKNHVIGFEWIEEGQWKHRYMAGDIEFGTFPMCPMGELSRELFSGLSDEENEEIYEYDTLYAAPPGKAPQLLDVKRINGSFYAVCRQNMKYGIDSLKGAHKLMFDFYKDSQIKQLGGKRDD